MTEITKNRFQSFLIFLVSGLLVITLLLNRWYAILPLLGFLTWLIRLWIPAGPAKEESEPPSTP